MDWSEASRPSAVAAPTAGRRVLVVDDDPALVGVVAMLLGKAGYEIVIAYDGETALRAVRTEQPDLVLLDLTLPHGDGRDICRRIRAAEGIPIIILSGGGDEAQKADLLTIGADDYVMKPFGRKELVARIGAVLRRAPRVARRRDDGVEMAGLRMDRTTWKVMLGGEAIALTKIEFLLLERLARADEALVPRSELLRAGWPEHNVAHPRWLKAHVARLRGKVAAAPSFSIESVRGVGYRLVRAHSSPMPSAVS